jgi:hypothetical protein
VSFVLGNPIRYNDPSGHIPVCDGEGNCADQWRQEKAYDRLGEVGFLKYEIKYEFGIEVVDGTMNWSLENLRTAYVALNMANDKLNGTLKSKVQGTKFTMDSQAQCEKDNGDKFDCYHGKTDGTRVTFYSSNASLKIPSINFLHETGHLLDSVPASHNVFSDPLRNATPKWVKNGYVNSELLGNMFAQPVQAIPMIEPNNANEYWADAFANYVAGNINLAEATGEGQKMFDYVNGALNP